MVGKIAQFNLDFVDPLSIIEKNENDFLKIEEVKNKFQGCKSLLHRWKWLMAKNDSGYIVVCLVVEGIERGGNKRQTDNRGTATFEFAKGIGGAY